MVKEWKSISEKIVYKEWGRNKWKELVGWGEGKKKRFIVGKI
jgi:hypothetical protein